MGVKFKTIVTPEKINLKDLKGKVIAIDASNTIYQFLSSIRQRDGTPLMDNNGNITSHLSGILYRTASIVENGIKPIYVFDGKPSKLKENTVDKRRELRNESEKKWKKALKEGNEEEARKFATRSSKISPYIIESSKKLLDYMGIPYVQSIGEGEAQASYMAQKGDAWAVASQDYDCLLFGSPKIIRNLTISKKVSNLEYLELQKVINSLKITREHLIDVALMIGTDFNPGIHGVGAKKGLKLIKSNNLEEILEKLKKDLGTPIENLRNIFLNPEVNTDYHIKWKSINEKKIIDFMCLKHNFSEDRVLSSIKKMEGLNTNQKSLKEWFG